MWSYLIVSFLSSLWCLLPFLVATFCCGDPPTLNVNFRLFTHKWDIEREKTNLCRVVRMQDVIKWLQEGCLSYPSVSKNNHLHWLPLFSTCNQLLDVLSHFFLFHVFHPWNTVSMDHFWMIFVGALFITKLIIVDILAFNSLQIEFKFAKYLSEGGA